jgi:hypothetical protein
MEKLTTKLSAQDRVILFCVATGLTTARLASSTMRCSPWPSGDSSRTIAKAARIRSRTAAALRLRPYLRMPRLGLQRNCVA